MELPPKPAYRLGLISDTHGYLPPGVAEIFRDVDLILHAGDIGSAAVVDHLEAIAPLLAVRGNMDHGPWAEGLPQRLCVRAGAMEIHLIHDREHLRPQPPGGDHVAVVAGHTHRFLSEQANGVLHVNPGSASAPRHGQKASVAILVVRGTAATVELVSLTE
ncbi:MAG: metallophosphatase family protein [Desulfobacterales bacterium]|jgi:putative phosphoesterase|nr:metallophosphatase family protein [Desulfobacterales bacterium]